MSLFRVQHNKNYTVINNTICTDKRLSWKAKGIWLYAFSRPDDWEFHSSDIINQSTDGRESVTNGLKELEKYGYLIRNKIRTGKGQYANDEWIFLENPQQQPEKLKEKVPQTGFPSTDSFATGNQPLLSTDVLLSTEKKQQQLQQKPAAVSFHNCLEKTEIPIPDKEWLTKHYTEEEVTHAIQWAKHPQTKLTKPLAAALKWACKNKPEIPKEKVDSEKENKEFSFYCGKQFQHDKYEMVILNKNVEIVHETGVLIFALNYKENGFKEQLLNALRKIGIQIK